jgi:UDP-glucose 4-epimerase
MGFCNNIREGKLNILVVGGAGYIGSHMAKHLYNAGYRVVVVDNLSTGFRPLVKYGYLEVGGPAEPSTIVRHGSQWEKEHAAL